MTLTRFPRPCPIPGHPQDGSDDPLLVTESAWTRLRAWHLHAPAERLPLPLSLAAWPAAWLLHAAGVPGHYVTYAAAGATVLAALTWRRQDPEHPRLADTEAATVTAAAGGWLAAAVTWGPSGWPLHLLTWIYVAGSAGGLLVAAPASEPSVPPAPAATPTPSGPPARPGGTASPISSAWATSTCRKRRRPAWARTCCSPARPAPSGSAGYSPGLMPSPRPSRTSSGSGTGGSSCAPPTCPAS